MTTTVMTNSDVRELTELAFAAAEAGWEAHKAAQVRLLSLDVAAQRANTRREAALAVVREREKELEQVAARHVGELAAVRERCELPADAPLVQLEHKSGVPGEVTACIVWLRQAQDALAIPGDELRGLVAEIRQITGCPDFARWTRLAIEHEDPASLIEHFTAELTTIAAEKLPILRSQSGSLPVDRRRHQLSEIREREGETAAAMLRDVLRTEGLGCE